MYICKSGLRYNGRLYEEGEEVVFETIDPRQIQELLDDGVIVAAGPEPDAPADGPAAPDVVAGIDHARRVELVAACAALDPDAGDIWTAGGPPKTSALEEIAGGDVSAALRDEAWELYSAAQPAAGDGEEE